jgi:hypothetical protein
MKFVWLVFFAVAGFVIASVPALAHRPYYSQIERIRLSNEEIGEVRLLHGDGIFFTDPVRPIIVDAKGRLVARGSKARSIVISCSDEHACLIVDLWGGRVYDLEPASFRQGPVQPDVQDGDRTGDWDLEDGDESWGFTLRDAGALELLAANLMVARQSALGLAMIAALAAVGALALMPLRLNLQSRHLRFFIRTVLLLAGLMVFLFLLIVTLWFSMLSGLTLGMWLVPTVLGAGTVWLIAGIARRRAHRAART